MFEIITVCTGNICRSPLAAVLLQTRLIGMDVRVSSAGTQGLNAAPMTAEALRLATDLDGDADVAVAHRSRALRDEDLATPDVIIALSREHRRRILDAAPSRMRQTFTAREFARLAEATSDERIRHATADVEDSTERMRTAIAVVSGMRGSVRPPRDAADDDVIDPYRRSWSTYQRSAQQLLPAVEQLTRVLSLAARP